MRAMRGERGGRTSARQRVGTLVVALVLLVALAAWAIAAGADGAGNAAEWVGALGTVGTLAAAVWVADREVDNRRADIDERTRAQAQRVSCWVEESTEVLKRNAKGEPATTLVRRDVKVRNGSDEPVSGVTIHQSPGYVKAASVTHWRYLAPGETRSVPWSPKPVPEVNREPLPLLGFYDSAGRGWWRDRWSVLRPDPDRSPSYDDDDDASKTRFEP